ncbi:tyrosine-protein phosphatase [Nocardia sp. GCM10030253]|uniref:tyrosine-protein phosphatase n=1 Tax=Nocardia sp. GCM10030253 TaxID=3273404 RepID=UPI003642ECE4
MAGLRPTEPCTRPRRRLRAAGALRGRVRSSRGIGDRRDSCRADSPVRVVRCAHTAEVMRLVLDDLTTTYGSVRRYLTEQVGTEEKAIEQLRAQLRSDGHHLHEFTGSPRVILFVSTR